MSTAQAQQVVAQFTAILDERIAAHVQERTQRAQALNNDDNSSTVPLTTAKWREDEMLKTIMTDLKSQLQVLSHCCVKLTLLLGGGTGKVSAEAQESMFAEFNKTVELLRNIYLRALDCSLSECMFEYVTQGIRSTVVRLSELLSAFQNKNTDGMTYATGGVTKLADELQKLPLNNKAAYRRFVMEKCMGIKETLEEFNGYISSAKEALAEDESGLAKSVEQKLRVEDVEEDEDEDEDEDYEDEEDEREYFREELLIVEPAINAIQLALDVSKATLSLMTAVGDRILAQEDAESDKAKQMQSVVAVLVSMAAQVESQVVDLGAELYPPVSADDESLRSQFSALLDKLHKTLRYLSVDVFTSVMQPNEKEIILNLTRRASECVAW